MTETIFLVERYVPGLQPADIDAITRRLATATAAMRAEGHDIRWLRSLAIPDDETCLCMFAAEDVTDVHEANQRASAQYERIISAIAVGGELPLH